MIRGIVFLILFWLYQIGAYPLLWKLRRQQKSDEVGARPPAHKKATKWAKWVLRRSSTTVEMRGVEHLPPGPVLIAANHQGAFDIPLLTAVFERPTCFIAKQELFRVPLVSSWMKITDCVPLDRSSARGAIETFKQAAATLEKGVSVIIFPEGTRSDGGPMAAFKKGSLRLIHQAKGIPILPVTINGSWQIKRPGSIALYPTTVVIVIHPPIDVTGLDKAGRDALPERVRDIVATGLIAGTEAAQLNTEAEG